MDISIHALREEGDAERVVVPDRLKGFLSTPSARRATQSELLYPTASRDFYPRPPRGGRRERPPDRRGLSHFYPRPPRGGRLEPVFMRGMCETFLSTPSARRATCAPAALPTLPDHFYPRPPRGGRPVAFGFSHIRVLISIHALREEGDSKNRDKISIFKQIIQHSARI